MIIHVIPINDLREGERFVHKASFRCACHPNLEQRDRDGEIWVHNAFDLREKYERFGRNDLSLGWTGVQEDEVE